MTQEAPPNIPTLFEWAGGIDPINRLVTRFYDHAVQDDLLSPYFQHMPKAHIGLVAEWFAEVLGGPKAYSERNGTMTAHPNMIKRHQELFISEDARRQWANLMSLSADEENLPRDAEFRSALMSYVEWGTHMAEMFSNNGATAPLSAPMPQWGWGETPPYIAKS
ncbi:MAG: group II truncated hemoglobin [Acidimicrobiales bacterium]|jgi:hemoglobin